MKTRTRLSVILLTVGVLLIVLTFSGKNTIVVQGYVVEGSRPVEGAIVRLRGNADFTLSDSEGQFTLSIPKSARNPQITAWAQGYYVTGSQPNALNSPVTLLLEKHPTADNPEYHFISPTLDMDNPTACAHCHRNESGSLPVDQWLQDAHRGSATNPRFLSLYNGTSETPTRYHFDAASGVDVPLPNQDAGFRLDFPDQSGPCAACHVPVLALNSPYDADPNQATGVAQQGISCDFCHKIWNVRLGDNGLPSPSLPGVLSLEMLRPHEGEQVFIGPFDDTAGDDIYSPLQNRSQMCAACHFGQFWDVPIYNSFGEWLASSYSDPETGKTCQDCHMPHTGVTAFAQLPPSEPQVVPQRDPDTIFSHLMPGAKDHNLLEHTARLEVNASREDDSIIVTVRVTNTGAGHDIPTDNPLRNIILLVNATDSDGQNLTLLEGPIIPEWGGVGNPASGHYADEPGVLYAKILADFYTGETPTYAYWRQTRLVSDNRIPALATDETHYRFALTGDAYPIVIEVKLLHRRAFIDLMERKGWDTPDILMAQQTVQVEK